MQIYKIDPQLLIYVAFALIGLIYNALKKKNPEPQNTSSEKKNVGEAFDLWREFETDEKQVEPKSFTTTEVEQAEASLSKQTKAQPKQSSTEPEEVKTKRKFKFNAKEAIIYSEVLKPKHF